MINKNDNPEGMRGRVIMVCSIVKFWKYPQVTKKIILCYHGDSVTYISDLLPPYGIVGTTMQ